MTRPLRKAAALCALALAGALAPAPARGAEGPELTVMVKPLRAEIGDPVTVELEIVVPAGVALGRPIFPQWGDTWGEAEVVAVAPTVAEPADDGATLFRQAVTLIPWVTGEVVLPAPSVEVPTATEILEVRAERPVTLSVETVLPAGEERPAPKPPAPPVAFPASRAFRTSLAIAVAACALLAFLLWWRRRTASAAGAGVAIDPHIAFQSALAALADRRDPLALIAGLSLALRRYLGGRLGFPAAESTTTEVRRRLQKRALPPELVLSVDRLLKRCDAVKFARRPIERSACDAPLAQAAELAARLEDLLRPAPRDDAEGGASDEREAA